MEGCAGKKAVEYKKNLKDNGFVHMRNVLPQSDVQHVRSILDDLFQQHSNIAGRYATTHAKDDGGSYKNDIYEINKAVKLSKELKRTKVFLMCKQLARDLACNRQFYSFDHAIYKEPKSGAVQWHQDQAYKKKVKQMKSLHFWVPLHNIAENGGRMQYVRGSNNAPLYPHIQCNGSHTLHVPDDVINSDEIIKPDVKIGDVIVHLPQTLHSSLPNETNVARKAWILHFSPYGRFEPLLPSNLYHYFFSRLGARINK